MSRYQRDILTEWWGLELTDMLNNSLTLLNFLHGDHFLIFPQGDHFEDKYKGFPTLWTIRIWYSILHNVFMMFVDLNWLRDYIHSIH